MTQPPAFSSQGSPHRAALAVMEFRGTPNAELFSRIVNESLAGTLQYNIVREPTATEPTGFVHASPPGQSWSGTCWTRDAGTFLRELTFWGAEQEMRMVANALMDLVGVNVQGFRTYPEYFKAGAPNSGQELDGTGMIIIALSIVAARLPKDDPLLDKIQRFLLGKESPVRYFAFILARDPLVAGSGEFGPGCFIEGQACNVVQNGLVRLALLAAAGTAACGGDAATAAEWRRLAAHLGESMLRYLASPDGGWQWCVTPRTFMPDPTILNHEMNDGFGGILGAFCMQADVLGLEPDNSWLGIDRAKKTFARLWKFPRRREMYDRFGLWLQFNRYLNGTHCSPSYGHDYALQSMLLLNDVSMVQRGLNGFAEQTYNQGQKRSPYFIFEQWRLPPVENMARIGCGELNLVNVTETLKVARLVLGVDDRDPERIRLTPRLPPDWTEARASNLPVNTSTGIQRVTVQIVSRAGVPEAEIQGETGLPVLFTLSIPPKTTLR
jgi:hypothetical protein